MQDNGKEDARKRGGGGGGADKRGGVHSRYQFFRCGKIHVYVCMCACLLFQQSVAEQFYCVGSYKALIRIQDS